MCAPLFAAYSIRRNPAAGSGIDWDKGAGRKTRRKGGGHAMVVLGLFFRGLCILGLSVCCALSTLILSCTVRCCRGR